MAPGFWTFTRFMVPTLPKTFSSAVVRMAQVLMRITSAAPYSSAGR